MITHFLAAFSTHLVIPLLYGTVMLSLFMTQFSFLFKGKWMTRQVLCLVWYEVIQEKNAECSHNIEPFFSFIFHLLTFDLTPEMTFPSNSIIFMYDLSIFGIILSTFLLDTDNFEAVFFYKGWKSEESCRP